MSRIDPCPLPPNSLLQRYAAGGGYADCYTTELPRTVSHAEFVEAFYSTGVFKIERWILRWAVSRPSTDDEAAQLARGERNGFAAWSVEARAPDQLLMCDLAGRTRSWLMVQALDPARGGGTRLFFGSAVVPVRDAKTGRTRMGLVFNALLGFHKLYSRALLRAAASRLLRAPAGAPAVREGDAP
jgi:hypothetical protein